MGAVDFDSRFAFYGSACVEGATFKGYFRLKVYAFVIDKYRFTSRVKRAVDKGNFLCAVRPNIVVVSVRLYESAVFKYDFFAIGEVLTVDNAVRISFTLRTVETSVKSVRMSSNATSPVPKD